MFSTRWFCFSIRPSRLTPFTSHFPQGMLESPPPPQPEVQKEASSPGNYIQILIKKKFKNWTKIHLRIQSVCWPPSPWIQMFKIWSKVFLVNSGWGLTIRGKPKFSSLVENNGKTRHPLPLNLFEIWPKQFWDLRNCCPSLAARALEMKRLFEQEGHAAGQASVVATCFRFSWTGAHFENFTASKEKKKKIPPSRSTASPGVKTHAADGADISVRSSTDSKTATAEDEKKIQEILSDPELKDILLDPRIQKLLETLRTDPEAAQR